MKNLGIVCAALAASLFASSGCGDDSGGADGSTSPGDGTGPGGDGTGDGSPGDGGSDDGGTGSGSGGTGSDGGSTGGGDSGSSGGTSGQSGSDSTSGDGGTASTSDSASDTGTTTMSITGGDDACPPNPAADARLEGVVYAPEGGIPVSGALVYTTTTPPDPIPEEVYCAECLELTCGMEDYVLTAADGSFSVQAISGAGKHLVVQKGQFRRVTQLDIQPGTDTLDTSLTTLPDRWNPTAGEFIPKIAVANGSFDRLEDALAKMGLGDTAIASFEERLVPGTEPFELWDNGYDPAIDGFTSQGSFSELVLDPDRMRDYHVIFVPCTDSFVWDALMPAQQMEARDNIRAWVEAGGRWYVADWAEEWMRLIFDEYQTFYTDGGLGDLDVYDSLATVLDPQLEDWLAALPGIYKDINPLNDVPSHPVIDSLPQLMTVDNWSGIQYPVPEIWVPDGMGGMVNVGHKVWLEGPGGNITIPANEIHPLTVTGQYGCGKVQFTSYHAAEFENYVGLTPQELVLMYTILEIGVCQVDLPPPQ